MGGRVTFCAAQTRILMEEMSPTVAVPYRVGNSVCENPTSDTHLDITGLKLMADTAGLLSDSVSKVSTIGDKGCNGGCLDYEVSDITVGIPEEDKQGGAPLLDMISEHKNNWVVTDNLINQESEEDDSFSLEGDRIFDSSCSLSVASETSSLCGEDFLGFEAISEIGTPGSVDIGKSIGSVEIIANATDLASNVETEVGRDSVSLEANLEEKTGNVSDAKPYTVLFQLAPGKGVNGTVTRSVFEVDCVPLWGVTSICGRRPEMEDAFATVPNFLEIPIQMLIGDRVLEGMSKCITHQAAHFFGVYDGHGGSQVANYCRDHIHSALAEEIEFINNGPSHGSMKDSCQELWKKTFSNCFLKVDAEVGGKDSAEPVAPETPNREDEHARIEAAGGKVIQWNGHRVCGVLAMSRSIGDKYLKPWIIPEPEVTFIPRAKEDECLILASDGLWDVMSNEEACDLARRRILVWHKKNGAALPCPRGEDIDPAAQAAAEYLAERALQKGSKDNITVIVVDLKAQRKIKSKT
ncbi:protein phosphatase 2C 53 isoform X2 [Manihot esculenta]|uniref:protein phosphatase 2C 53 isoform X2 n=1 Tax=Manihot esculenta TaxID=3983 RepID=UPI000B5D4FF2|nr:protein phosphatase 2C 53 isoform X2 [Manihot esculenta]